VATLLRTGVVGFNAFLHHIRVPGIDTPACPCGWHKQTPEHMVVFCPNHETGRAQMWSEAGTDSYTQLLQTPTGLKACAQWVIRRGMLHQFDFARNMAMEEDNGIQLVVPEEEEL
jgi:hypothetical protein